MELDTDRCYRAVTRRDQRFDGRFFTAVVTTGVYCRTVCPAPTPKRVNVRFYACAAAAEAAGFRPCRRCRPETSPGTPAWLGTSATVSRALRQIADGALDDARLDDLAGRLGIGDRHLRRLFLHHLGASPIAIAQTRRLHFARRLIDETALPASEIAFAAGFASIRRFNDAIRHAFGKAPTALRNGNHRHAQSAGALVLRLPFRPPFDWAAIVRFLEPRATPGIERVNAESYRRTISVDGAHGMIEVRPVRGASFLLLHLTIPVVRGLIQIVERTRRLFDLGADPAEISGQLRRDAHLRHLVDARPGLRVPGAWDGFELAVRAILGQQVTVRGATTLAARLVQTFGEPLAVAPDDGLTHLFPTAAVLAKAHVAQIGIPKMRADSIRHLAAAVSSGDLSLDASAGLDEIVGRLTQIPGIGPWTAHYIAMRSIGEPDAFPTGDLGLRRALGRRDHPIAAPALARLAEAWRPWRAYAAMHLWTSLSN